MLAEPLDLLGVGVSGPDERPYRFDPDYRAEALAATPPDGPPSRRALQLAIAIMVWILGLALLAAHFAAGGTL